ncbi:hypothetical protein, partial [Escherichia coli]|uniref:hypothetical protein n=1 Tax=Escherichia coli TaxID=562 RepID=UPI001BD48A2B
YEMARQLPASRLLMIDSHLPWPALRRMPPSEQYQRWLSAEMREWIALMSDHPMKHYRQVVSPQLRQQALDWILAAAQRPDPALEPEFDIADDERREAKK